ncbi:MAG: hypothetical protein HZB53_11400 [Chloroflexi bacterium]|nr:hypothetical protein [Chloroflexota bacterium]
MRRQLLLVGVVLFVTVLAACGPSVTVSNMTTIPVRVIITSAGQHSMVSPSPHESSTAEVQAGPYVASVVQDSEWLAYAKLVRQDLNEQLANADRLSGAQLLDVIRRLKDIAARMQAFEKAAGVAATCTGTVEEDGSAAVEITQAPTGALVIRCK